MTQVLQSGLGLVESVRWRAGRPWFADWFTGRILLGDTGETVAQLPAMPVCFDWLPDGRLVTTGGDGVLRRLESDGSLSVYAELGSLSDKPWNEVAVDANGSVFVDNIGFDFPTGDFAPGFVAVVTADGETRTVAEDLAFPNGMVVAGDVLLVAESYASRITAFDIAPDGGLRNRRVWAQLADGEAPDGISLAPDGSLWYASVPQQHCVRVAEGGAVLQTVELDRGGFSCAIGAGTLYVAAADFSTGNPAGTGQLLAFDVS